ncbi:ectoine synthase [Nereida sp. MMG025]|uniref:ectoine synthase n=1 Tax=Nereida sp. MMG025 TaxID=2909981 RepID=UPI001F2C0CD4|nr:ectoine synthase [Nereida sp. MMG025]MCF6443813.1 ectoine synthase [Nereida sp. MMG025]
MHVVDRDQFVGTRRDAKGNGWDSLRLLVRSDGMGFSVNETTIHAGAELVLHYKHHVEACYILEGHGEVTELETGRTHTLRPGTLYCPDDHKKHRVLCHETMRLIAVFLPALEGDEVHDADGSYPAPTDDAP